MWHPRDRFLIRDLLHHDILQSGESVGGGRINQLEDVRLHSLSRIQVHRQDDTCQSCIELNFV